MIESAGKIASPAAAAAADPQREKLKGAAQAFEAVFLRQLIGSMRSASLGEDILGSDAQKQFRDMADSRMADSMAQHGTLGIAQMLIKQFQGQVPAAPAVETGKASAE